MKKSGVPFLLGIILLTLIGVQGVPTMKKKYCFCLNTYQRMIHLKSLKDLKQFSPDLSCDKTEIIATMKNGTQVCLNPDSTKVKNLVKVWEKQVRQKGKQKKGKNTKKAGNFKNVKRSQRFHQKKTT